MKVRFYIVLLAVSFFLCCISVSAVIASASTTEESDFVIKDGVLKEYKGNSEHVVVPDEVTVIGSYALVKNQTVVSIVLPKSITKINKGSFSMCSNLEEVTCGEKLTYIGESAFQQCNKLKKITFGDCLRYIGDTAFEYCENLTSISSLKNVESIGQSAFWDCEKLVEISAMNKVTSIGHHAFGLTGWLEEQKKSSDMVIVNGILIDGTQCEGKVYIPKTVTQIATCAFAFNKKITYVEIPSSVKSIGQEAFSACYKLESVRMSDSVTEIGSDAFYKCTKLKNIRLSNSLKSLEDRLFTYCRNLNNITLPESFEEIGASVFDGCIKLSYITIPKGISKETGNQILTEIVPYASTSVKMFSASIDILKDSSVSEDLNKDMSEYDLTVHNIQLNESSLTLEKGERFELRMNSYAKCSWKSSDSSIASVNHYGSITAKKKGVAVITATLYGTEYQCKVNVK